MLIEIYIMFKVLIVEDNASFRNTLRGILEKRFSSVAIEEAENSSRALHQLRHFKPDLIFMDIRLPGGSGLDLTRQIRPEYPHIPIIMLTNHDAPEYRQAALQYGVNCFISKKSGGIQDILSGVEDALQIMKVNRI